MLHSRHLYVNARALKFIDSAFIGDIFQRLVEKALDEPPHTVLVEVQSSDGIVAFGEEPCGCSDTDD